MIWNQLSYELQNKVIDRIVDLLKEENDDSVVDGIMAAVHELDLWSNKPCQVIETDGRTVFAVEPDPFCEKGWD
jgi:hypothetical protein